MCGLWVALAAERTTVSGAKRYRCLGSGRTLLRWKEREEAQPGLGLRPPVRRRVGLELGLGRALLHLGDEAVRGLCLPRSGCTD